MSSERASPFAGLPDIGNLDDIAPRAERRPPVDKEQIRDLGEAMNFVSRPARKRSEKAPEPEPAAPPAQVVKKLGRRRTGRTYPFGTKVTVECYNAWIEIAEASGKTLGELMEISAPLLKAHLLPKN